MNTLGNKFPMLILNGLRYSVELGIVLADVLGMNSTETKTLPERIKAWRVAKGLSLESAARQIDVSTGALWQWEQGRKTPKGLYRQAIERALSE